MDVDPLTETTDFEAMRDNRDCGVLVSWDPPHRYVVNYDPPGRHVMIMTHVTGM